MKRDHTELEEILEVIYKKICLANRLDELDDLLLKWAIFQELEETVLPDEKPKYGKIVIIGGSLVKETDIRAIFNSFGINEDRLEFCLEYKKVSKFNYKKMQYNPNYSVILVGAVPHSGKNMGDAGSIIAALERDLGYPPVIRATSTNALKFTAEAIKERLVYMLQKDIIRADK